MRVTYILPVFVAVAIAACGGAHDSELFGAPSGGSATDDSGATTGGLDGGAEHDASSGVDASPQKDAGAGIDASLPPDAGKQDSGPVGGDPGIFCGKDPQGTDVFCAVGQQSCCAPTVAPGNVPPYTCVSQGGQCSGTRIACDDTADCSGKICCGAFDNTTQSYTDVTCRSSCSGTGPNGTTLLRFCDPALSPSDCPVGTTCLESGILPGFYRCN
jgi:hypothetical protein